MHNFGMRSRWNLLEIVMVAMMVQKVNVLFIVLYGVRTRSIIIGKGGDE